MKMQSNRYWPAFRRLVSRCVPGATVLAVALLIWQLVADLMIKDTFLLPSPKQMLIALWTVSLDIPRDTVISLLHFAIGLMSAAIIAVPVGGYMGWSRSFDRAVNPLVQLLRPIPPLAWIPFALIWLGLSHWSAGFIVFVGSLFPVIIATYTGFRTVPKVLLDAARVLGCSTNRQLLRRVAFPAAVPMIASGLRTAMGVGWMSLIAAEIFGQSHGLGYKLWHYYNLHQMDNVVAYMLILGITGSSLDAGFRLYVHRCWRWHKGEGT